MFIGSDFEDAFFPFPQVEYLSFMDGTLLETNGSPLKIGNPKRKRSYSNHPFSGAKMLVSWRGILFQFVGRKEFHLFQGCNTWCHCVCGCEKNPAAFSFMWKEGEMTVEPEMMSFW